MLEHNIPSPVDLDEVYLTDKQLCTRWNCSPMFLWRKRKLGLLKPPAKFGGRYNRTALSEARRLERAGTVEAERASRATEPQVINNPQLGKDEHATLR